VNTHAQGNAQKIPGKTLHLYLRLIIGKRQPPTCRNNNNNNNNRVNLEEGGESDFQSHHIIRFKCPVFNNNKNHKSYIETETEKFGLLKEKRLAKYDHEKDLLVDIVDKNIKTTLS